MIRRVSAKVIHAFLWAHSSKSLSTSRATVCVVCSGPALQAPPIGPCVPGCSGVRPLCSLAPGTTVLWRPTAAPASRALHSMNGCVAVVVHVRVLYMYRCACSTSVCTIHVQMCVMHPCVIHVQVCVPLACTIHVQMCALHMYCV